MPMLKRAVLLQAVLARLVLAERRSMDLLLADEVDEPKPTKVKELMNAQDQICGGPEIWEEITRSPSVSGVQNIKWAKIDTIAENFIKAEQAKIKVIQHSLESLAQQIEQAKAKEHLRDATREEIAALVTAGAKVFGDNAEAQRINCGAPGVRPRSKTAPRRAYRKCVDGFEPEAHKLFQGSVKLGGAPFLEVCGEQLTCKDEKATCYCDRLCQEFRDISQAVSDQNVGESHRGSDDLVRKRNELQEELAQRESGAAECANARGELKAFAAQLEQLKGDANARHEVLRDAEYALYDAQEDLDLLEEDLEKQQEAEAAALETLKAAGADFEAASAALEKLQASEKGLVADVGEGTAALAKARKELEDATNADKTMSGLRELVSVTIMKMEMYFDAAVQAPVRGLGIEKDLDLSTVFVEQPQELTSAGDMRQAVEAMATYCAEDGQAAIGDMKGKVDLSPLCSFGSAEEIKGDINKGVLEGLRVVRHRIEQVKGWLDPYRGMKNMNDTVAAQYAEKGEPMGLRRIINSYGNFNFYKKYLKLWKINGPFLKLLEALKDAATQLQKQVEELARSLASLQEQLETTTSAREAAVKELEKAKDSKQLAEDKRAELGTLVEELKQKAASMKKDIEGLEAKVREAQQKYDAAVQKIKAAHEEATSFLESVQSLEEQEELSAAVNAARDRMVTLEAEAERARQEYYSATARASWAGLDEPVGKQLPVSSHRQ